MYHPILKRILASATLLPLASLTLAASNHSIWPDSGVQKQSFDIAMFHPHVAVPSVSAGKGWYTPNELSSPMSAMVNLEAISSESSLCRMTAYPLEFAVAFQPVCSKGMSVASGTIWGVAFRHPSYSIV
jgi:hypothetical protein